MFKDRIDAGIELSKRLEYMRQEKPLIMAIPRGGVIVGDAIAMKLDTKLDIVCPRKLGAPANPELAIGAVMHDGTYFLNYMIIEMLRVPRDYITRGIEVKKEESRRRVMTYRKSEIYDLEGKSVVLVDDGIATGATVFAAADWLKRQRVSRLVIAVPVGAADTIERLKALSEVIALMIPLDFRAVGEFYENFEQVSDEEVIAVMKRYGF